MQQTLLRFCFGLVFFAVAGSAEAASLYIDPPRSELNRGDAIELSVRLDVDEAVGQCINAVEAVLSYTENIVPVDVSLGDSIFSMWVEQPVIDTEARTISFAGGMPNGYCGRVTGDPRLTNNLVTIIFRSPGFTIGGSDDLDGQATVAFTEFTAAYLNDGLGTKVSPRTFDATLQLSKSAGSGIVDPWREAVAADTVPPEEFSIFLEKDTRAFSGKYYISFNTTDKQTGIDQYQIIEEPIEQLGSFAWGGSNAPWVVERSPYVLKDQSLNSIIRVKAIDKAGNEYIATLIPDDSLRTISRDQLVQYGIYVLIGLIVLGCLGVIVAFFVQKRKKRRREDLDSVDEAAETEEIIEPTDE